MDGPFAEVTLGLEIRALLQGHTIYRHEREGSEIVLFAGDRTFSLSPLQYPGDFSLFTSLAGADIRGCCIRKVQVERMEVKTDAGYTLYLQIKLTTVRGNTLIRWGLSSNNPDSYYDVRCWTEENP